MSRLSILLCSEGTYPFYPGGVSVWCDQLIRELKDYEFRVLAITHAPSGRPVFPPPANVIAVNELPLWGTDEPGQALRSFSEIYRRKVRTTAGVIRSSFVDAFCRATKAILNAGSPETLATALVELHVYFSRFDYLKTMSSSEAWETFLETLTSSAGFYAVSLHDATTCMRWLQRFLAVLTVCVNDVQIMHSSMAGLAGVPAVIAKLTKGTPYLLSEHGIYLRELYLSLMYSGYSEPCRRFLLAFHKSIVRLNYHFANRVTALGAFNKQWQLRLGASEAKIRITPNGIHPGPFRGQEKRARSRPVVLTMARIYHLKGIQYLLHAAAEVRSQVPSVLFRILGDIADPAYHARCCELVDSLQLHPNVEFGASSNAAAEYGNADVFCLPSISEGMPYSILEAMFSGCPVVATDVGNVAEMLGTTGLVVRPADPASLAKALLSLLAGEERARDYRASLASNAEERANRFYTVERATGAFRNLYGELTNETCTPAYDIAAAG
jgi:glycosyltransferase involved in cell wall biosynthesis